MKKLVLAITIAFVIGFASLIPAFGQTESDTARDDNKTEEASLNKSEKYEAHVYLTVDSLSRDLGTWKIGTVYFQRKFENKQIVWGTYRVSDRNGNRDQEFVGGIYKPFRNKTAITAEAMYSPSHKYVGKFSVMGEAEKVLKKGYVVHGGARFTKYDSVNAITGYGLVEKYWGANRAAYTMYITNLSNAGTAPTHRFQYNRYYGERVNAVGAAFTFGKEHENLGPQLGILRSQTWSVSLSARHWVTQKFGVSLDGTLHRQGDIYYRRGLTVGARYRF